MAKKKFIKKKKGKKQNRALVRAPRTQPYDGLSSGASIGVLPKSLATSWPEVLRCTFMYVDNNVVLGNTTSYRTYTYKGNSLHSVGPQVNFAGAFGTTGVTGAVYALAGINSTGSNAPYGRYRVVNNKVRAQFVHYADGSGTPTNSPVRFSVFPSSEPTFSSMPQNVLQSQPYVKNLLVPAVQTSNNPATIHHAIQPCKLLGIDLEGYRTNLSTSGVYQVDPQLLTYWHIYLDRVDAGHPLDGGSLQFRNELTIEFFDLNPQAQTNL